MAIRPRDSTYEIDEGSLSVSQCSRNKNKEMGPNQTYKFCTTKEAMEKN